MNDLNKRLVEVEFILRKMDDKYTNNIHDDLLPLYLRKPQAERMLEEKLKNGE